METLYEGDAVLGIVDISGYTGFMMGRMELAHAQTIIADLLESIIDKIQLPLKISKLEGDAVLFYGTKKDAQLDEIVAYTARQLPHMFDSFYEKREEKKNTNQCRCKGCAGIEMLQLKAITHVGPIIEYTIKSRSDPEIGGLEVIIPHRLLKNSVKRKPYIIMTKAAYPYFKNASFIATESRIERYDSGPVQIYINYPDVGNGIVDSKEPSVWRKIGETLHITYEGYLSLLRIKRYSQFRNLPRP